MDIYRDFSKITFITLIKVARIIHISGQNLVQTWSKVILIYGLWPEKQHTAGETDPQAETDPHIWPKA